MITIFLCVSKSTIISCHLKGRGEFTGVSRPGFSGICRLQLQQRDFTPTPFNFALHLEICSSADSQGGLHLLAL